MLDAETIARYETIELNLKSAREKHEALSAAFDDLAEHADRLESEGEQARDLLRKAERQAENAKGYIPNPDWVPGQPLWLTQGPCGPMIVPHDTSPFAPATKYVPEGPQTLKEQNERLDRVNMDLATAINRMSKRIDALELSRSQYSAKVEAVHKALELP